MLSLYLKYRNLKDRLKDRLTDEEGQGLVEYALIIALISIVILGANPGIVTALQGVYNRIASFLNTAGT